MSLTIAYLTGEYPRATDTFIQREIVAVEESGVRVERFAVRAPGDEQIVGELQRSERSKTTYLLGRPKSVYLAALLSALRRSPAAVVRTARLAARTRRLGLRGSLKQVAYFVEAALLSEELRGRGVQHLHNHFGDSSCSVAMLAAELSGIPYSFTLHGPAIFYEPHEWQLGTKIERAAFVAVISDFARSQACLFSDASVWDRLHIVHCGVADPVAEGSSVDDGSTVDAVSASGDAAGPAGWPHVEGTTDLLFVGRLDQVKGVMVLFDALVSLLDRGVDVRLSLVGDGPQRAELERRCARLGLETRVRFFGYQNADQVQQHLERCDVFVLPSFAEGVPVSLMEAMAKRRPVIATAVGGVTELVAPGKSGLVVPPGNVEALATAIETLAGDASLRTAMGSAGARTVATSFSSRAEAAKLVALFAESAASTTR
ncbi:MAG: glycosyltransferase family 4 protein [Actinobacteria bacterium]|nr:glycosyltransferase family 4 protein [Actinomycetota bacterium]